ncbi:MAG: hypothetical protein VXW17_02470, partial [Pseudomonadota bacterium]|nr:hypothetical protein [Pseudomonadota bacterium]
MDAADEAGKPSGPCVRASSLAWQRHRLCGGHRGHGGPIPAISMKMTPDERAGQPEVRLATVMKYIAAKTRFFQFEM